MKIALAQINPTSGDIAGNEQRIADAMRRATALGADLMVSPEMGLPGYLIGDQIEELEFLAANRAAAERLAARSGSMAVVFGFIEHDPRRLNEDGRVRKYNAAMVAQGGKVVGIARKSLLPSYRYFEDKRYFTPGSRRRPIPIRYGRRTVRLGVSICEDMWDRTYRVKPIADLVRQRSDILLNINASPFVPGKRSVRGDLIRAHVAATRRPFVYVNTVGVGDNGKNVIPFDGESLVYDARGRLVHLGPQFAEDLAIVDLDERPAPPKRRKGTDRRDGGVEVPLPPFRRDEEIYHALCFSLREYARHGGFRGAIVPVSGGIDSSLAFAIAVAAFGPGEVAAYNLPSRFNSDTTRGIARRLCASFGVPCRVIPIDDITRAVQQAFEGGAHPIARSVTAENIQARARGLLMMAEANDTGRLLISCGNETEVALGYATLYGDMCGGLALIGDLSKTDVYRLARHVNTVHGREMIPEEVFTVVPSAELRENQRDPFDYAVTAPLVSLMMEGRQSPTALVAAFESRALDPDRFLADADGRTVYDKHTRDSFEALVYETYGLMKRAVYKRLQGPPIVVVSERGFGFDLRETIINGWTGKVGN
jgi:NAD+ synthase (glutamine-hydrolysing)